MNKKSKVQNLNLKPKFKLVMLVRCENIERIDLENIEY